VLRAAQDAYVSGMSEVFVVTAAMMVVGAALMAVFMPARAPHVAVVAPAEARPAGVAS
jgi:hypothetical protein